MHLFFDTVWKLHIGEIPEKPKKEDHATYLSYYPELFKYNEDIAVIKQNALTVGNADTINVSSLLPSEPKPGEFYFWPGGYYVDMWNAAPRDEPSEPDEVAILTLPEEEKDDSYNLWLEYGKEIMGLSIYGAQQKVEDVSRYVFEEISKKYKIVKV